MRSISTKMQTLIGATFLVGLSGVLSLQTYLRIENTWAERMDANLRIVKSLSVPARNAITLKDRSQVLSYMELLSSDPRAAGIALSADGVTMVSQQSISHFDLDIRGLEKAAVSAELTGATEAIQVGHYEYVSVPVTNPALRPIGAIGVAWDTEGLLKAVWMSAIKEAALLFGMVIAVMALLVWALRKLVTLPLAAMARLLMAEQRGGSVELPQEAEVYRSRRDEIGTFAEALQRYRATTMDKMRLTRKLDGALSSMKQGLCMINAEGCVSMTNERFSEMYDLPGTTAISGWDGTKLVEAMLRGGNFRLGSSKKDFKWLAGGAEYDETIEFIDDVTYNVSSRKAPDGGWVITHTDVSELKRAQTQLLHLARHDPLTNLPNRRRFRELIDTVLHDEPEGPCAILFLDLDRFKLVNDTLGHQAGDELLRVVAARLLDCVRAGDTVSRLGGDEFAILQRHSSKNAARVLSQRVIKSLSQPIVIGKETARIGVSIGIALSPEDGNDAATLLQHADLAVYEAKNNGRNRHSFFNAELAAAQSEKQVLEMELREAVASGGLELYYQPIVDALTQELRGVEALVRWNHPTRGLLAPGMFIPLAEQNGLIVGVGEWVLREACRQSSIWPANVFVAVNISPVQIRRDDFSQLVFSALAGAQMRPGQLHLEITEGVLLTDDDNTVEQLNRIKQFGVHIVLDDFGTGQSALTYLQRFPVDKIKIDRSFAQIDPKNKVNGAVVEAIVSMSKKLGVKTVAEGVETEEEWSAAERRGVDEIQGFLVCPPVPPHQLQKALDDHHEKSKTRERKA